MRKRRLLQISLSEMRSDTLNTLRRTLKEVRSVSGQGEMKRNLRRGTTGNVDGSTTLLLIFYAPTEPMGPNGLNERHMIEASE